MSNSGKTKIDPWISALYDPVAQIKCFSSTMQLADLAGDGDGCLITADSDCRLRVFKGTALVSDHALLDVPVAMCTFYTDTHRPRTPAVAVASGTFVYIYRNLRPYFKFTLPSVPIHESEKLIWDDIKKNGKKDDDDEDDNNDNEEDADENGESKRKKKKDKNNNSMNPDIVVQKLAEARDKGVPLTSRSHTLLSLSKPEERVEFIKCARNLPLKQQTVVTCMKTLKKDFDEDDAVSSLVIGTEAGTVLILDPPGSKILNQCKLPSVPTKMAVVGKYAVGYRIVIACRDGNIYQVKDPGELSGKKIELEAQPVDLICLEKNSTETYKIVVACMDNTIHVYRRKGKKDFSLYMPSPITNIEAIAVKRDRVTECYAVALEIGEVRVYNGKNQVSNFKVDGRVRAMRYGSYGRENTAFLIATQGGSLHVKFLKRGVSLEGAGKAGAPPEQDVPLNVPKRTKMYVDQTQREREQAVEMHRAFQRDLCKLRLTTARAYVKIIGAEGASRGVRNENGPQIMSTAMSASNVRLNVRVQGLGPNFRLIVDIQNTGKETIMQSPLIAHFEPRLYKVKEPLQIVPLLIPGLLYHRVFDVECIDENGGAGEIHILLTSMTGSVPMIVAVVNMPISEMLAPENV
jgi:Bardet-Biedl syndrome 1 protein